MKIINNENNNNIHKKLNKNISIQIEELAILLKKKNADKKENRLAVIDTQFPWMKSGFRYWENLEIYKQLPNTLFFAVNPYIDDFPANVFHISELPNLVESEGITHVYSVFLNLTLSLLGETRTSNGIEIPGAISGINIKPLMKFHDIKLCSTIYPGGGLDPTTPKEFLRIINENCYRVFTNAEEVLNEIPKAILTPVIVNTDFYSYKPRRYIKENKIIITFCANKGERKGFPNLVNAFNRLEEKFHLNIIGDWENELYLLTNMNYTYYGPQNPEIIRDIYWNSHVFINCSYHDVYALDGFPTTAAVDAMSTGCLLITTNSREDSFFLKSGLDYILINVNDPDELIEKLEWVAQNFNGALRIADNGAVSIREQFNNKKNVKKKLSFIMQ